MPPPSAVRIGKAASTAGLPPRTLSLSLARLRVSSPRALHGKGNVTSAHATPSNNCRVVFILILLLMVLSTPGFS